jgi:membrane-associated phospholipid phosphatase
MQALISYLSNFDYVILYAVQSLGAAWYPVARFISYGVGSYTIMLAAFLLVLLFIGKWRIAFELFIVAGISAVLLLGLKHYFGVDRPYVIDPAIISYEEEGSFALPSGHALMSVVILGWVALRHPRSHTLLWGTVVLVLLIGASRIYLGVHYPSQVAAGWLFGILFLYIFRIIDKRLWTPFQKKLS